MRVEDRLDKKEKEERDPTLWWIFSFLFSDILLFFE
uniref:Uncharacterized protein n=1 Tax=Nelumbo nucifera TaxID=4432 RepID=A0A822XVT6_NELNU|nr:TPA_asm: hypothetical protein HUJ06_027222 [Nelumbo nucifera]